MLHTSMTAHLLSLSAEPSPATKFREEYYQTRTGTQKAKLPARPAIAVDPFLLERMWLKLAPFRLFA